MKEKIFSRYQAFVIVLLVFLNLIVFLDFVILTPLGPLILRQLSISASQYAWVVSVYAFCAGISGFLAAGFADKFDRKKMLIFSLTGFIAGTIMCAISPGYNFLLIARIVTGSFGGILSGTSPAIITDLFKMEVRGRVIGFVQMAPGISQVMGIPLALFISNHFGWHAAFWVIVIIAIISGIATIFWMKPVAEHLKRELTHNAFLHLIRTISRSDYLLAYASSAVLMLAVWMILPFNATFITNNANISINQLTILYLVTGIATFIAAPIIGKICDRFGKFNVLLIGSAISLIIIPYYTSLGPTALWLMVILNIIFFVAILSRMVSVSSLITGIPKPQDRGAFMNISSSIQQIIGGIAASTAGLIVVQSKNGRIEHYDMLGFCIMATIVALVIITYYVNRLVKIREGSNAGIRVLSVIVLLISGTIHSSDAFGQAVAVKNIVLVHGIFVDGSGWEGVYKILTSRGYHVMIVQNPTTSLEDDIAAVNRTLDKLDGPAILVGHSWGGAVISEAGVSPKVAGLVYVAAFQPDAGESALSQFKSAPALIEGCILPPDSAGFFYADKAKFRACSSADLPANKVEFMSVSQIPATGKALSTPLTQAAWKTKPCWGIVPTADKSLNPVIQRSIYKRSGTKVTEIEAASHFVYISQPMAVANVIEAAAKGSLGGGRR